MRTTSRTILAVAVAAGLALPAASAAHAAPVSGAAWVASPHGVVGIQQSVVIRAGKAKKVAGKVATVTFTPPGGTPFSGQTAVNQYGFAAIPWMPSTAGTWTVSASVDGAAISPTTIAVAAMPTEVDLLVPAQVAANTATSVRVEVLALAGPITPSGTITLKDQNGNTVGTGTLGPSSTAGTAVADVGWTPSTGTTALTATYTPTNGTWSGSMSGIARPSIGGAPTVTMRMPEDLYSTVPVTLTAISSSGTPAGGVAFSLNIDGFLYYPMGGSKGINTGPQGVDFTWTPGSTGFQTVQLSYASNDFGTNANASQQVNVMGAPTPDTITVSPSVVAPWQNGALAAGGSVDLPATSLSGNPVTMSTSGPCQIQGTTLTVLSPGTCTVTSTSLGNGGSLAPATQTNVITITK